jgi:heat-inducible transcriptional repressor
MGFLRSAASTQRIASRWTSSLESNSADIQGVLDRVGSALSAATQGASLVLAPKHEAPIQHIDFVPLSAEQALVVLVFSDGHVENRVFNAAQG